MKRVMASPQSWGSVLRSFHQCLQRPGLSKLRLGCPSSRSGRTKPRSSPLEIRNVLSTRHGRKTKPKVSESTVTDIDTLGNMGSRPRFMNRKAFSVSQEGGGYFPPALPFPSSLNRSDCLARSQHHLWLRVHLFWITIPPLDLRLTLESHFSRNYNEFEDTSWKNTLLWQLRFPWVIDNRLYFPLVEYWGSKIYWLWIVLRDKDKNRPFWAADIWQSNVFHFGLLQDFNL